MTSDVPRDKTISMRVTWAEHKALSNRAWQERKSVSQLIRELITKATVTGPPPSR